jgi:3-isopropylmalate/(R)-2-methylmalate dehydratase small subunit
MKLKGKIWKFGDDINTDLIIPGKYLELVDPKEMALHAMEGIDPKFPLKVAKDDIIVGGFNFGCGSSREHAPLALKYAGVGAVIAESFARIFFRNSYNIGLPALECPGIAKAAYDGDFLLIDIKCGLITNTNNGTEIRFSPLPSFMIEVLDHGGLVPYLKKNIENW